MKNVMSEEFYESKPAIFLDLDGTVRKTKSGKDFPENVHDQVLIPGVEDAIFKFKDLGYLVFGVTNQAGVAHGFKSLKDVEIENEIVNMSLLENHTERIFDFIFYSPCDPKGRVYPYANKTLLRKPNIGMLCVAEYYAFHEMHIVIEWDNSLMVGDRDEDKNCAQAAGVRFAWAGSFVSHVDNWIKDLNPDI